MITKVEFKENSNKNNNVKKRANRKYPKEILKAFKYDYNKCDIFYKTMYGYMCGRHILELSPLHIYNLQNGYNAKKNALINLFKYDDVVKLNIENLPTRSIIELADLAYGMIYKGLVFKLKGLDLNYFMTPDKIINAGNVIKNHNGTEIYGGNTIRDFLAHYSVNEKKSNLTEDELNNITNFLNERINIYKNYGSIKSIPFSVFRYSLYIKTDENKTIIVPDIEAKHNLQKILGVELYEKYHIKELSMIKATYFEAKIIKQIKKTLTKEMYSVANNLLIDIPEGKLKEHAILASSIDNVTAITGSGIICNILEFMSNNIINIKKLYAEPERLFTAEEQKSLFQIEYTALRMNQFEAGHNVLWINDISKAIKGKYANLKSLQLCIEYNFAPVINDKSILDYKISYDVLYNFYVQYIIGFDKNQIIENNEEIMTALSNIITH